MAKDKGSMGYIGLSGGVDSAVAALLLKAQGFRLRGVHLRLWEPDEADAVQKLGETMNLAEQLGIPLEILDWRERFKQDVIAPYLQVLADGRTPNPCIQCNRQIKWGALWEFVQAKGAEFLASGHYARLSQAGGLTELRKAAYLPKDQSYFLSVLPQAVLQVMRLPLGELSKAEVRGLAEEAGLSVAASKESEDLCFLDRLGQGAFLEKYAPELLAPGPILDRNGKVLGQHSGLPLYTIGQRKGIRVAAESPLYVMGKDIERNALLVGRGDELAHRQVFGRGLHWLSGKAPALDRSFEVKLRAAGKALPANLQTSESGDIIATLETPVRDITSGQYLVIYDGELCLGSAEITGSGYFHEDKE